MNKSIKFSFHHIGIVTKDIDESKKFLSNIFEIIEDSGIVFDKLQNAYLNILKLSNGIQIELISGEIVKNLLSKGITYYHICFTIKEITKTIEFLKNSGAILVSEPKPAILFNNKKVAFLYTPIGLIELLED